MAKADRPRRTGAQRDTTAATNRETVREKIRGEQKERTATRAAERNDDEARKRAELKEINAGERHEYYVVGPGQVGHAGALHAPDAVLHLTEAEAKSLGPSVARGTKPKRNNNPKGGGLFQISGPGSIYRNRRLYHVGDDIELTEPEAVEFADRIQRVA